MKNLLHCGLIEIGELSALCFALRFPQSSHSAIYLFESQTFIINKIKIILAFTANDSWVLEVITLKFAIKVVARNLQVKNKLKMRGF